jgi:hypothetical protein
MANVDAVSVASAAGDGNNDLGYQARGRLPAAVLVWTHAAMAPLLYLLMRRAMRSVDARCLVHTEEALVAEIAREKARGGGGGGGTYSRRYASHAIVVLTHFLITAVNSVAWHVCSSCELCLVPVPLHARMADHFSATTSVPVLLVYAMPHQLRAIRMALTAVVYAIQAYELAARPAAFGSAWLSVIFAAVLYAGHNAALYALRVAEGEGEGERDAKLLGEDDPRTGRGALSRRGLQRAWGIAETARAVGVSFSNLTPAGLAWFFCVLIVAGMAYGIDVDPVTNMWLHGGWHVVAFYQGAYVWCLIATV